MFLLLLIFLVFSLIQDLICWLMRLWTKEGERSHVAESKCGFYFYLECVSSVFHSGGGNDETVFPVSGSFLLALGVLFVQ